MKRNTKPILHMVIPCYNEQDVLPITNKQFESKIKELIKSKKINETSKVLFVNDGSKDNTWDIIKELSKKSKYIEGISLSRNRGHQNAVLAGLMEVRDKCDIAISIDCDGQDDINAMDEMVEKYLQGYDIVYGVRSSIQTDTFFKRFTAETYYKLLNTLGVEVVYNHSDYRLTSSRVLNEFSNYTEVNLYLRGMFPLVGFQSCNVAYERKQREAGQSHYPLSKMLSLAIDGITSLSIKPIRLITCFGIVTSILSLLYLIVNVVKHNDLWISTCLICLLLGITIMSIGIVGEYVGKAYMETKHRPRYIVGEKTYKDEK